MILRWICSDILQSLPWRSGVSNQHPHAGKYGWLCLVRSYGLPYSYVLGIALTVIRLDYNGRDTLAWLLIFFGWSLIGLPIPCQGFLPTENRMLIKIFSLFLGGVRADGWPTRLIHQHCLKHHSSAQKTGTSRHMLPEWMILHYLAAQILDGKVPPG